MGHLAEWATVHSAKKKGRRLAHSAAEWAEKQPNGLWPAEWTKSLAEWARKTAEWAILSRMGQAPNGLRQKKQFNIQKNVQILDFTKNI